MAINATCTLIGDNQLTSELEKLGQDLLPVLLSHRSLEITILRQKNDSNFYELSSERNDLRKNKNNQLSSEKADELKFNMEIDKYKILALTVISDKILALTVISEVINNVQDINNIDKNVGLIIKMHRIASRIFLNNNIEEMIADIDSTVADIAHVDMNLSVELTRVTGLLKQELNNMTTHIISGVAKSNFKNYKQIKNTKADNNSYYKQTKNRVISANSYNKVIEFINEKIKLNQGTSGDIFPKKVKYLQGIERFIQELDENDPDREDNINYMYCIAYAISITDDSKKELEYVNNAITVSPNFII
jgi:hypothetical protein